MNKYPKSLIAPVLVVICLDLIFTLLGQPSIYWQDFSKLNEGSPLAVATLSHNPLLFVFFMLLYILVIYLLLKKLPLFLAIFTAISFFLGHLYGSSTWVYIVFKKLLNITFYNKFLNWYVTVGYIVLVSFITSIYVYKQYKMH